MSMSYRGHHVLLDYILDTNTTSWIYASSATFASWMLYKLKKALKREGVRIVGEICEVFDGSVSPPGFAIVIAIDESHVSAHLYEDTGLLAIDVFTCSPKDPERKTKSIAEEIHSQIKREFNIVYSREHYVSRFPYRI